jgi:thioredoxin-like negative regulator of GroEL
MLSSCGQGKPRVMVFLGKSSKSYDTMKPIADRIEKRYQGTVIFDYVDYDNPKNKVILKKYNVSMNPTILVFNAQGQIKEQYLGSVEEGQLDAAVQSFIPTPGAEPSKPATVPKNLQY